MKNMLSILLLLALPAVGQAAPNRHAAPARHTAAKKAVHHMVSAVQAAPQPASSRPAGDRPFSDVPPDHWAAAAVETLRQRGIVVGYPPSK